MNKKLPTIKEIAKVANVSAMTVSRALNKSPGVREQTRKKIVKIANRLNYRPNRIARSLVSKKSGLISLIVEDIRNQFFAELARGIEDHARENGYNIIFCSTDNDTASLKSNIRLMMEIGVEGFILAAVRLNEPIVAELIDQKFPVVIFLDSLVKVLKQGAETRNNYNVHCIVHCRYHRYLPLNFSGSTSYDSLTELTEYMNRPCLSKCRLGVGLCLHATF